MTDLTQEEVDLTDVEIQQCPYDAYKKLRDNAPIYQDPKTGFFIVTRYEDVRHCLLYTSPSPRDQRSSRMPSSA